MGKKQSTKFGEMEMPPKIPLGKNRQRRINSRRFKQGKPRIVERVVQYKTISAIMKYTVQWDEQFPRDLSCTEQIIYCRKAVAAIKILREELYLHEECLLRRRADRFTKEQIEIFEHVERCFVLEKE